MAVKIRLKRMGKIRTPFYRVVIADSRSKRDGRAIEEIGTYNPKADPSVIHIDSERAQHWLSVGAQPSEAVAVLLKLTGDWQKFKGEEAPGPVKVADPKRDKAEIFNEALKEVHGSPKTEAVTKSKKADKADAADDKSATTEKPAKKAAKKADEPKAEEPKAETEAPAAEETKEG